MNTTKEETRGGNPGLISVRLEGSKNMTIETQAPDTLEESIATIMAAHPDCELRRIDAFDDDGYIEIRMPLIDQDQLKHLTVDYFGDERWIITMSGETNGRAGDYDDKTPEYARHIAGLYLRAADICEELNANLKGRRVVHQRFNKGYEPTTSPLYWLGTLTEIATGDVSPFGHSAEHYRKNGKKIFAGMKWAASDGEFLVEITGLYELLSERDDDIGLRVGIFAEVK